VLCKATSGERVFVLHHLALTLLKSSTPWILLSVTSANHRSPASLTSSGLGKISRKKPIVALLAEIKSFTRAHLLPRNHTLLCNALCCSVVHISLKRSFSLSGLSFSGQRSGHAMSKSLDFSLRVVKIGCFTGDVLVFTGPVIKCEVHQVLPSDCVLQTDCFTGQDTFVQLLLTICYPPRIHDSWNELHTSYLTRQISHRTSHA
jgi:hypothetical protein